jgi:hypothetical protein
VCSQKHFKAQNVAGSAIKVGLQGICTNTRNQLAFDVILSVIISHEEEFWRLGGKERGGIVEQ